ncbi:MAG: anthranilate synthase component I, partial [Candidatus Nitrosothermus koennekii]
NYWEDIRVKCSDYPTMEFGIYTDGLLFDHINSKTYYFFIDKPRFDEIKFDDEDGYLNINNIERNTSIEEFKDMVIKAKNYIYDGDIYQVVLSKRFNLEIKGDRLPIYANLRKINPSPYMYMLKMDNKDIIGSSPEMLVRTVKDKVETFPIAGTRPISKDREKNEELKQELLNDEKELAEHTMLVDLARNDLGRVCKWGSVKVDELMSIKEFSHVQHIVSHVTGILDNKDCYDALRAVFPAGTVSGAPKVRAMEIIDELEKDPRGPYAGALGYFSFNGSSDFAITIRSLFINGNNAYVQSGAGIVADSDPEKEWYETEHKAQAVLDAIKRCIEC